MPDGVGNRGLNQRPIFPNTSTLILLSESLFRHGSIRERYPKASPRCIRSSFRNRPRDPFPPRLHSRAEENYGGLNQKLELSGMTLGLGCSSLYFEAGRKDCQIGRLATSDSAPEIIPAISRSTRYRTPGDRPDGPAAIRENSRDSRPSVVITSGENPQGEID